MQCESDAIVHDYKYDDCNVDKEYIIEESYDEIKPMSPLLILSLLSICPLTPLA